MYYIQGLKSLKVRNGELGGVCMCLLNEPQMKHPLSGGPGNFLQKFFGFWGRKWCISSAILGHCAPIPLPPPLQKNFLSRFTMISRMVLEVGKKSEIRLKTENFDPCYMTSVMRKLTCLRLKKLANFWSSKLCKICSIPSTVIYLVSK